MLRPKPRSFRRFAGTVAAAVTALALMTAAAVPARASERSDDFAKAIAALAAVAIIGSAVNDRDDDRATAPYYARPVPPRYDRPGHFKKRYRAIPLPAQCAQSLGHRRNATVVYGARCLRNAGLDIRLPQRCRVSVAGRGRDRTAYEQNCLLQSGFTIQGRRRH